MMRNPSLNYLSEVIRGKKGRLSLLIVLQIAVGSAAVAVSMVMRNAIDTAGSRDLSGFYFYLLLFAGIMVLQILLRAVIRREEEYLRAAIENDLKSNLLNTLMSRSFAQVTKIHSGEWMNRLTSDTRVVAAHVVDILPNLSGAAVKLIASIAMILYLEPRFAWLLLPAGILSIFFTYVLRRKLKEMHREIQEADGDLRIFLQERLGSLMIVKAFGTENSTLADAELKMQEHYRKRMRRNAFSNLSNVIFAAAMNGMYFIGFAYSGYGILHGSVSFGTMLAIIQLIGQIQSPFANLSGYIPKYYAMIASIDRIREAASYEPDGVSLETAETDEISCENQKADGISRGIAEAEERISDFKEILLQHVTFSYPGEDTPEIIHDLTLQIRRGEYIALTGPSGCGKSTLFKLLLCLYQPVSGQILVRGADGRSQALTERHRRLFAYVPQGNFLMNGSVRDVILGGDDRREYDAERMEQCLKIACADIFVNELERGVDTWLGERGAGLSEGQLQRISIARALYTDRPVLLFDEATSALDETTEHMVLNNIRSMTDKTVLIVTHRPAALEICDRSCRITPETEQAND